MMLTACATTATSVRDPVSGADLIRQIEAVHSALQAYPDPLADLMRSYGFDPDSGDLAILPRTPAANEALGQFLPPYVRLSAHVKSPLFVRASKLSLNPQIW